jgi:hypothetical protein
MTKWSTTQAAQEFGVSPDTLTRRLREAGHKVAGRQRWTVRQCAAALYAAGDIKEARCRRETAEAELAEIEVAKARRTTVDMAEVVDLISRILQPFRSRLLAAPAVLGQAANPSDPVHGSTEVGRWVDSVLPLLRQDIVDAFAKGDLQDDEDEPELNTKI